MKVDSLTPQCVECGAQMPGSHIHRKYCSSKCKSAWYRKNPSAPKEVGHACRVCGKHIDLGPGQNNKWICSDECRRASVALSSRKFAERRPQMVALYRARTKEKLPPDSNIRRFYLWNPSAPRAYESCGEDRVLEVAHKPGHERLGSYRSKSNSQWPEMVWVLCPTCHRLLDRMGYSPDDLGISLTREAK